MKSDLRGMGSKVESMEEKVDKMFHAMMGSDLLQDGGLIRTVIDLKTENKELKARIDKIESNREKTKIYINLLWLSAGAFVQYLIQTIFKK